MLKLFWWWKRHTFRGQILHSTKHCVLVTLESCSGSTRSWNCWYFNIWLNDDMIESTLKTKTHIFKKTNLYTVSFYTTIYHLHYIWNNVRRLYSIFSFIHRTVDDGDTCVLLAKSGTVYTFLRTEKYYFF